MTLKRNPEVKAKLAKVSLIDSDLVTVALGYADMEPDFMNASLENISEEVEVALIISAVNDFNVVGNVILAINGNLDYQPKSKAEAVKFIAEKADDVFYNYLLLQGFDILTDTDKMRKHLTELLAAEF
jgi:hypothetical protein